MERYWRFNKEVLEEKPVLLVIYLTQIKHGVAWDLTRATASKL